MPGDAIDNEYARASGYAERYRSERFAVGHGPRTDARERRALAALLAHPLVERGLWLDLPSGAGRLSGLLPGDVVRVDRDAAMLRECTGPRVCASGMRLPFRDRAFAGGLCMRLVQHLAEPAQREALFAELARVCRAAVVISFFDRLSLQHARRALARGLGKPSGRTALARGRIRTELERAGLQVVAIRALSRFVSEQTLLLAAPRRP